MLLIWTRGNFRRSARALSVAELAMLFPLLFEVVYTTHPPVRRSLYILSHGRKPLFDWFLSVEDGVVLHSDNS